MNRRVFLCFFLLAACGSNPQPIGCPDGEEIVGEVCRPIVGTDEVCDGVDNDLDGEIDEALTRECGDSEVGACTLGTETCDAGEWMGCDAVVAMDEVCEGSVDENCDGEIDEDCSCEPGTTRVCGSDAGACAEGVATCGDDETWGECVGSTEPVAEACDGIDNDCNGEVDDDIAPVACGTDVGQCMAGLATCVAGALVCDGEIAATEEMCDGMDNDCDGVVDPSGDGRCALGSGEVACTTICGSVGVGECTDECNVAAAADCTPPVESCTYADDDCDGAVDEGLHVLERSTGDLDISNERAPRVVQVDGRYYGIGRVERVLMMQRLDPVSGNPMAGSLQPISAADASVGAFDAVVQGDSLVVVWIEGSAVYGRAYTAPAIRLEGLVPNDAPTRLDEAYVLGDVAVHRADDRIYVAYHTRTGTFAKVRASNLAFGAHRFSPSVAADRQRALELASSGDDVFLMWADATTTAITFDVLNTSSMRFSDAETIFATFEDHVEAVATDSLTFVFSGDNSLYAGRFGADGLRVVSVTNDLLDSAFGYRSFAVYERDGSIEVAYFSSGRDLWRARLADTGAPSPVEEENLGRFSAYDGLAVEGSGDALWFMMQGTRGRVQRIGCF